MGKDLEVATLAGGCFWCLEAVFDELKGVESVESGYSGGHVPSPSYAQVCDGDTGHAEVVQVTFDPQVLSYKDLLTVFFTIHDPTTLNRQGNDVGTQYRSAIFYHDEDQKKVAEEVIREISAARIWDRSNRDRSDAVRQVLHGRRLPSGILQEESFPGLLPGGDCSESGQVSPQVCGETEEITERVCSCDFSRCTHKRRLKSSLLTNFYGLDPAHSPCFLPHRPLSTWAMCPFTGMPFWLPWTGTRTGRSARCAARSARP